MKTILTTQSQLRDTKHVAGVFFLCAQCNQEKPVQTEGGTGYGYNLENKPVCYACCGDNDRAQLRTENRATLYLNTRPDSGGNYGTAEISNWPGTLKISGRYHKGAHNIAGSRYDVWFSFDGANWHGVQYGENTQILHCRKLKK